ncbi:MAG: agmatine deiminase family protein [Bacteroidetes bacterium]|nr:agmatine deiminase family protein [Bacteroidota bacterium]
MNTIYAKSLQKIIFGIVILLSINTFGQDLPVSLTPQEKLLMKDYYFNNDTKGYSVPPSSKVRSAAEWEEIDALIVTWTSYTPVIREIVRNAVNECKVYIVCSDSNSVKTYLTAGNISLTNVKYVIAPFNTVWVRDYSANNVYTNDVDSLLLVDWTYNRPRPKDDTLARTLTKFTGLPLYEMTQTPNKLVATGGNYMSDGLGTAFASKLILNDNALGGGYNQNLTEAQIDTLAKKYLGIHRYIKFETLPFDEIHHIDMHMKLLDEETILVGQYPNDSADGPQIEANLQYLLANHLSVFGTPYRVVRMPMPPKIGTNNYPPYSSYFTYTNGVFVNKTFLYPTYYTQYDTIAQHIYEKNLPGYNVVGIDCNSTISSSGAIHCITHCIASNDPLLIVHQPVKDTVSFTGQLFVEVKAMIKHRSGISHAKLHYVFNDFLIDSLDMLPIPGQPDYYKANIPLYIPVKNTVLTNYKYYITAEANSGKKQCRPITAPTGFWSFKFNQPNGINENKTNDTQVQLGSIYPNPASAVTCIPVETTKEIAATIELFDMIGEKVQTIYEGKIPSGNKNFFINATDLRKGVYFVKLSTKEYSVSQKLVVK